MSDINPAEIVAEAVREYVGDGDGADEEVLASYEQQVRDRIAAQAWEEGYAEGSRGRMWDSLNPYRPSTSKEEL